MHTPIVETTLRWSSEEDTAAWAQAQARRLRAASAVPDMVIELHGPLGAGKTTLVRHLLRALGVQGRIKSPTYALLEPYEIPLPQGMAPAWHLDLYRFEDAREWEDAGLRDVFAAPGLKLVEWPERAQGLLPTPDLAVYIEPQEDPTRAVRLVSRSAVGRQWQQ